MRTLSLKDSINLLENDLIAVPQRISVHYNLPFAILRYDPTEEWNVRREAKLLGTRLEEHGKKVYMISLSELLWEAIEASEGLNDLVELEQDQGFEAAQEQVNVYLSDSDWSFLPEMLAKRLSHFDPTRDIVFLMRAAAMAPAAYQMSKLLDEMQGLTDVTTILFYPGTLEGTTGLRFMALQDRQALGNYRVKIYG